MLISQLIEALQEAQNELGDVPVYAGRDSDNNPHTTQEVLTQKTEVGHWGPIDSSGDHMPADWVELR